MRASTAEDYQARLERLMQGVLRRLDSPLTVDELAQEAGFSRFHLGRIFQGAAGEPLSAFVRRLRLERAAYRLHRSEMSATEAAFEAGYDSLEAFSRAFRSEYKVSPSDFRSRSMRPEIQSPNGVHWSPDVTEIQPVLYLIPGKNMEIKLVHRPEAKIVALRHKGAYHEIGAAFGRLMPQVMQRGIPMAPAVAVYYDDPGTIPTDELRSDAGMFVGADFELSNPGEMSIVTLPGGDYAVALHEGPYEGLGDAWARFMGQAEGELGRKFSEGDACFEIYLNDCMQVPPSELKTELYTLLAD